MDRSISTFFNTYSSFTSIEAKRFGISPSLIAYYIKKGEVERVSRGVYRSLKKESLIPAQWEDLVATAKSIPQGVICLVSALQIYELTEEFAHEHWIAIPFTSWPAKREHTRIIRMRNLMLGKSKMPMGEDTISIFDRERTLIDCFRLLSKEVALKALKKYLQGSDQHKPDFKKLNSYSKKLRFKIAPYIEALTT
jgi:predicted transcriptional regulator of viral defense system